MAIIQRKVKILDSTTGKNPIIVRFSLPEFRKIQYGELHVNIGGSEEFFGLNQFKLKRFVLNGNTFFPSSPVNSINVVHNILFGDFTGGIKPTITKNSLQVTDNRLEIHYEAPFGTGTISPEAPIDATLILVGESEDNPVNRVSSGINDFVNQVTNLGDRTQTGIEKATLPTIIIIIAIIIALIVIAFIALKFAETSGNVKETQQGVSSDVKQAQQEFA